LRAGLVNPNEATLLRVDEYSRMAEAYETNVVPRFAPLAARLVERAQLRAHATVLDVSTGTGLTAILAAKSVGPSGLVVGIDLADGALQVAQTKAARLGLRNLRFEMLDSRNIVYRGGTFDAALTSFGLPSLGHEQVLREVHRVLKEGASVHLLGWAQRDPPSGWDAFDEVLGRHQSSSPSPTLRELRTAGDLVSNSGDGVAIQTPSVVAARLRASGFSEAHAEPASFDVTFATLDELVAFRRSWGETDRELAEMTGAMPAFLDDLRARFEEYHKSEGYVVRWSVVFYDAKK
jgi:ubiquinone/menaquinone biosynthesis C-methylase UbiE